MKQKDEKKRTKQRQKRRRRTGSRGVITVFVVLIMVPVVTITSIMVDLSRLKLYSSQALVAADAYGDSVLSEFDNLLKDLYGLFAVTQNEEGLAALETLAQYAGYSFNPNGGDAATGGGLNLAGFMPYKNADVQFSYKKVDGASLSNNNVLMTQVSDFMKYRIIEEVLDEAGILNAMAQMEAVDEYMEVVKSRNEITDSSAEALGKIDEYYEELKKLAGYSDYLGGRERDLKQYWGVMKNTGATSAYRDYVNYLKNKDEIDAAKEAVDRAVAGNSVEGEEPSASTIDEDTKALSEQWVDEQAYRLNLIDGLKDYRDAAHDNSSYPDNPINFENTKETIENLGKREEELRKVLEKLQKQVDELKQKLADCSDEAGMADVKEQMQDEIKDLDDILDMAADFRETYKLIEPDNKDIAKNDTNKKQVEEHLAELDEAREMLLNGKFILEGESWPDEENESGDPVEILVLSPISWKWYDFQTDKAEFFQQLKDLCEGKEGKEGDKKAGDKQKKEAQDAQKNAEKEIDEEPLPEARDISSELASQLASHGNVTGTVPSFSKYFSDGISFDAVQSAGSRLLDKFLVVSYDTGMFSSRVSGIRPPYEKNGTEGAENGAGGAGGVGNGAGGAGAAGGTVGGTGGESEPYKDYSLTKVEMSQDVNYLYRAELEYLLGGHNNSEKNLKHARNLICGVRATMNFFSTYTIEPINTAISELANAAAVAVAATVIGAPAATLVRVAVSGALRIGVAAILTSEDWKSLKARKDVVFFKTKIEDVEIPEALAKLLKRDKKTGFPGAGTSTENKITLAYEDYLFIMMLLLVDDNTLLNRTSNLITLNVNQALNKEDELSTLSFKMADTVTAVETTCKIKADFAVVPENFLEMYLKNTSTETTIRSIEDHYFGYSVIRGY